jgi:tRNA(Ile2) C34 agmatinyltransferase TiaS
VSVVATTSRSALVGDPLTAERPAERLFEPPRPGGGVSLEDLVLGAWEDLSRDGHAGCPVCGGRMHAAGGCDGCGSSLS